VKEKKRAPTLLAKKLKALPAKRKKRGPLKRTELGKKKAVIKKIKPRKRVTFKKTYGERREQGVKEYQRTQRYGQAPKVLGSRGDPARRVFRRDAAGQLVQVPAPRRKIRVV